MTEFDDASMDELRALLREVAPSLQSLAPQAGVERYLAHRRPELTPGTGNEYRRKLGYFLAFCERRGIDDLTQLDGRLVDAYRTWRRDESAPGRTLGSATMRDDMYLFRAFLRYCESIEAVRPGLAEHVVIPPLREGDGVRDVELGPDRVAAILAYLEKFAYASRDHVVWLLHCRTGRRPGAIHSLDVGDVHGGDDPYLAFRHRPDQGTRLKNGVNGEADLPIRPWVADVLTDYIESQREPVTDEFGREPLVTSAHGRLSKSAIRVAFYAWSRPCVIGEACPHDEDPGECAAAQTRQAACTCPSSQSSYSVRHGHITHLRRLGLPKSVISDRCDVSEEIIEKHYDERSEEDRRQLQRELFAQVRAQVDDDRPGYI